LTVRLQIPRWNWRNIAFSFRPRLTDVISPETIYLNITRRGCHLREGKRLFVQLRLHHIFEERRALACLVQPEQRANRRILQCLRKLRPRRVLGERLRDGSEQLPASRQHRARPPTRGQPAKVFSDELLLRKVFPSGSWVEIGSGCVANTAIASIEMTPLNTFYCPAVWLTRSPGPTATLSKSRAHRNAAIHRLCLSAPSRPYSAVQHLFDVVLVSMSTLQNLAHERISEEMIQCSNMMP
jgi:hypothetical protein